jgi:hypothetical protein
MTESKELLVENAVSEALPRTRNAEFEVNYHEFIRYIQAASIETRLELIQDILGDTSNELQTIRSLSIFVDAILETNKAIKKG